MVFVRLKLKINYKGIVAIILSASLGITVVSSVLGAIITGRTLSPHTGEMLAGAIGAMVGALATYFGSKND